MIGLCVLWLNAAAPEPVRLSGPTLETQGVGEPEARHWSGVFANLLRRQGLAVGPHEAPDGAVLGELARAGSSGLQISLRVERAGGERLAAFSMTAQTGAEVAGLLQRAAQELAGEVFRRLQRAPVPQKLEPLPDAPKLPAPSPLPPGVLGGIIIAAAGAVGAGAGLGLYIAARDKLAGVARGAPESFVAAEQQATDARSLSTVSVAVMGVSGLVLLCGVLYALHRGGVDLFITVSPFARPGEGGLALTGALP